MIVSFDDKTTAIATIPLPAITICTTEKASEQNVNLEHLINALKLANQGDMTIFSRLTPEE